MTTTSMLLLLLLVPASLQSEQGVGKTEKITPVAVAGCLKETSPDVWMLMNATDPVPSTANAVTAKERAALTTAGNNEFRLIGVVAFNLPAHRNHAVIVKGLPIKAAPVSRLNITSLTMVAEKCPTP